VPTVKPFLAPAKIPRTLHRAAQRLSVRLPFDRTISVSVLVRVFSGFVAIVIHIKESSAS
jgi:hypothetical protein